MATDDRQYLQPSTNNDNTRVLRSSTKNEDEPKKIRVGSEYQAVIPDFEIKRRRICNDLQVYEMPCWLPSGNYSEKELDIYVSAVTKINKFTIDQALAFLLYHNGNIQKAVANLENFTNINKEIEPHHVKYVEILVRSGKFGKHFVPDNYEFDESYMRMVKDLKLKSLMDNICLWESDQIKKEENDFESETKAPYFVLYNGMELLQLHHNHGNAKAEFNAKHLFHKTLMVKKEQMKINDMIEDCEAEIRLVCTTPIDDESIITTNWTTEEKNLLTLAYREFNNDYAALAGIIGSKTAGQVSEYCINHFYLLRPDKIKSERIIN